MKIVSVIGARPQFIKSAPVSSALRKAGHDEFLLHTGQHYDYGLSRVFFEQLDIPEPDANLGIGSGTHAQQTGQMLIGIEQVLQAVAPDWVLVYGDTNSTLAGALAAVKLNLRVAHIEAGLRSFNRSMPEEHNRVLTDHCSALLFCPTRSAVENLVKEGIEQGVHWVGDVMYDAALQFMEIARKRSSILEKLGISPKSYLLATVHRAYNTDDLKRLRAIMLCLNAIKEPVIFPVHPRTAQRMASLDMYPPASSALRIVEPVGYLDMLVLEQNARMILTDSGGVQKEAYFFAVPCITLRPETEWLETIEAGWNQLAEPNIDVLHDLLYRHQWPQGEPPMIFGDGVASKKIASLIA